MNVANPLNLLIKILVEKSINQYVSNSNIESTNARAKLISNWSNIEPNNTIQLQNFHVCSNGRSDAGQTTGQMAGQTTGQMSGEMADQITGRIEHWGPPDRPPPPRPRPHTRIAPADENQITKETRKFGRMSKNTKKLYTISYWNLA